MAAPGPVLRLDHAVLFDDRNNRPMPAVDMAVDAAQVIVVVGPDAPLVRKYLRVMAAVELPDQGEVELLGISSEVKGPAEYKELRARLGYMIGDGSLLPIYNGLINVMLPALYHQRNRSFREVSQDARALLDELGCSFDIQMLPHAMSRFQQSQVQLARALILTPEILYIEEPFHRMTTDDRHLFSEKMMSARDRIHTRCIIISTDYLGFAQRYADRILFIDSESVEIFDDWETFSNSRIPAVVQYLGREPMDHLNPAAESSEA